MSMELATAVDLRLRALTSRVDDLEKACGILIARLCDLEVLVAMDRPLPGDYGRHKHLSRNGGLMAAPHPQSLSDAPEAPEPTDRAPTTLD